MGVGLNVRFWSILSMGMSKLGWLVRLKTSMLYFSETRSVNAVTFTMEMSARFCQDWRKMLRCPPLGMKLVSNESPAGMAPFRSPGWRIGIVKQDAFNAGKLGLLPVAPVSAFWGVQPGANGTIGFVMPSLML